MKDIEQTIDLLGHPEFVLLNKNPATHRDPPPGRYT